MAETEKRVWLTKRTLRAIIDACRDSDDPEVQRAERWARQEAARKAADVHKSVREYLGFMEAHDA